MIDNSDDSIETIVADYEKKLQELIEDSYEPPRKNFWFAFIKEIFRIISRKKSLRINPKVIEQNTPEYFQFRKKIMNVLAVRETLEQLLVEQSQVSADILADIRNLDRRLKEQEDRITTAVDLAEWRETLKPQTQGWWWFLVHPWDQRDGYWRFSAIVLIVVSLSLAANIIPRFWAGGLSLAGSTVGSVTAIGTSLVSLLLGKEPLDQALWGRKVLEGRLEDSQTPRPLRQEITCFWTMVFLAVMLCVSSKLPIISWIYNRWGETEHKEDGGWNSDKGMVDNSWLGTLTTRAL